MKCMDTCIHLSKVVKTFRSGNGSGLIRAVDGKELRALRDENDKLKRLVAEKELHILGLNEIAKGNF